MCSNFAKYGLGIFLLTLIGLVAGAFLFVYGFVSLWWPFPSGWEVLVGLNGQPQELVAMRVPEGSFLIRMADGQLFECEKGTSCAPARFDWSGEQDVRACSAGTRPWATGLFPPVLNWNTRAMLGCEVSYMDIGRNVFVLQDGSGASYATYGAVFLPTDAGVIIIGLLGGLVGAFLAGMLGVVLALVLLASAKRK